MSSANPPKEKLFTGYQIFIIAVLSILQFTIILDFMVLSPLSAILMPMLKITTSQFGNVVAAYAISAGISGLLAAGFADKFDRKKLLLIFYAGFLAGTFMCALAVDYTALMFARIVTGVFAGVIGSVSFAIITDLFKFEVRGRVMAFAQMGFAASQILGLPIGLKLTDMFNWHAPFWMIGVFGAVLGVAILIFMRPVAEHLKLKSDRNAFQHLIKTFSVPDYYKTYFSTMLLATGGFMLMPFGAAFSTNNLGLTVKQLPDVYFVVGLCSVATAPFIGKLSDKIGKFKVFVWGTLISSIMVAIYTPMGITPIWIVIAISVVMFAGITSRMISSSAIVSAIPEAQDRGAFMSISASMQQFAGGFAATVAGKIVYQSSDGMMHHYPTLGYVVIGTMILTIFLMYWIDKHVKELIRKRAAKPVVVEAA